MDIEPLKSILEWSEDKKETLLYYLPNDVKKKVYRYDYEEKQFYIHDRIFCIAKNTLELEFVGRILFYENEKLGIKVNSIKTVTIEPEKYYLFVHSKKTINKQREFLKQLLEQI